MVLPEPALLLPLLVWGALVGVDGTSLGQFMISRPLVAATVAGWICGDPVAGAAAGVLLEGFHLTVLPVGAARYPEGGPAAVASGALFALSDGRPATLLTVLVFFLAWQWVSGESVQLMRRINVRFASFADRPPETPEQVERRHLAAVGLDAGRCLLLVVGGLLVLGLLLGRTPGPGDARVERFAEIVLVATFAGVVAATLRFFGGRARLFAGGLAAGLLLVLLLR